MRRATSIARFTRRKTLPAVAPRLAALVLSIGCAACSGSSPTPNNDNTESDSDEASTQATSTTSTNSTLPTSGGDETQTDQELSESTSDGVDSTSTDIDTSTTATTNGSDSDSTITSDQSSETSSDSTQTDTQDELEPCPAGTTIEAISSGSYYAQPGVVFPSAPITGNGENHAPKKLEIKTSRNGQAVAECKVRWLAEAGNGWAFAAEPHTDAQGINYAYWTAGDTGTNLVRATIDLDDGSSQSVAFSGEVSNASSRTDSVWLTYDVDSSYDAFKIRITPRSGPANTYYSALNWRDSYAGIQFVDAQTTMVLFSVWDAGGEKAKKLG